MEDKIEKCEMSNGSSVSDGSDGSADSGSMLLKEQQDETPHVQEKSRSTLVEWLVLLCTAVAVLCSVICIIATAVILAGDGGETQGQRPSALFESKPVCVTCRNLVARSNPFDTNPLMDQLKKVRKDGKEICCAENSLELSALFELVIQKLAPRPASASRDTTLKFSPVSAHKILLPNKEEIPNPEARPQFDGELKALTFARTNSASEHVRNVEIGEDYLVVPHTGIYYVYVNLHFKSSSIFPGKEFLYKEFYGYMKRISVSQPAHSGILMKLAHYVCDDCVNDQETAFSGGAFQLYKGDKIQISTAALNVIKSDERSSYAGLVMLSSG